MRINHQQVAVCHSKTKLLLRILNNRGVTGVTFFYCGFSDLD